jgi:hypothetical protein
MSSHVPAEVVFSPQWWFRNYQISFDESFYFDPAQRIRNDVRMRQVMYERFHWGEPNPRPRPILGSQNVAGGFVLPALFGCKIRFQSDAAPLTIPRNLSDEEAQALAVPDLHTTWPMNRFVADMDRLESQFGSVCGDFDLDGVLNTALHLRGQQLYLDFYEAPQLVHRLFSVIKQAQIEVALYVRAHTGTCAVSTNRSILNVDPAIFLHSNCAVLGVSPKVYEEFLLPYEQMLAEKLAPYGIHHCGNNLHLFTSSYARLPAVFFDVGWGSDVARCRKELPAAFLNLRLSPVRMLQCSAAEIRRDTEQLLTAAGSCRDVGVCCINVDDATPDENVRVMFEVAASA